MIKLLGFPISNYYNKIKLVMLEKGIAFSEEMVRPSQDAEFLARSPLGKIPVIETDHGPLSESQAILEYLEETYPENKLFPADPYARAKCRELIFHTELNVELEARRLYKEAFFGGTVSDETKQEVREKLNRGLAGLHSLAQFKPFIAGTELTAADCAAFNHFNLVSVATMKIYGECLISKYLPEAAAYMEEMKKRPAVQKVEEDRKAAMARMG
ncbi:MAG: glutathione S-transferase family protein [Methylococcaceae bacterium]